MKKIFITFGVIILIVISIVVLESNKPKTEVQENTGMSIGDFAPNFELISIDDSVHKLSDYKGRPVIINFFASWCPPCRAEMPEFENIHKQGNIIVIGVNLQENPESVKSFADELRITFPLLLDYDAKVKVQYNVITQPVTYFIDSNGVIVDKKLGPLTSKEITEKIEKLGQNKLKESKTKDEIKTLDDGTNYIIHPDKFRTGASKDGIPSIDNPKFESIEDANNWLPNEELGLGINYNSESRFYPFRILVGHEIVNDNFNDDAVLITYCPLCFTGMAFDRTINGESVEFGVSGKLYNSELVMYDRLTDSYWPQTLGKAVIGPLTGHELAKLPTDTVLYGDWKKAHPDTVVLSRDTGFFGRIYTSYNPYGEDGNFEDITLRFPLENEDNRLSSYEIVYGIKINETYKAYPKNLIKDKESFSDMVGETKLRIEYDNQLESIRIYDEQNQLVHETLFFFAWAAFHPETLIYSDTK